MTSVSAGRRRALLFHWPTHCEEEVGRGGMSQRGIAASSRGVVGLLVLEGRGGEAEASGKGEGVRLLVGCRWIGTTGGKWDGVHRRVIQRCTLAHGQGGLGSGRVRRRGQMAMDLQRRIEGKACVKLSGGIDSPA